jgi:hypothetical protein
MSTENGWLAWGGIQGKLPSSSWAINCSSSGLLVGAGTSDAFVEFVDSPGVVVTTSRDFVSVIVGCLGFCRKATIKPIRITVAPPNNAGINHTGRLAFRFPRVDFLPRVDLGELDAATEEDLCVDSDAAGLDACDGIVAVLCAIDCSGCAGDSWAVATGGAGGLTVLASVLLVCSFCVVCSFGGAAGEVSGFIESSFLLGGAIGLALVDVGCDRSFFVAEPVSAVGTAAVGVGSVFVCGGDAGAVLSGGGVGCFTGWGLASCLRSVFGGTDGLAGVKAFETGWGELDVDEGLG